MPIAQGAGLHIPISFQGPTQNQFSAGALVMTNQALQVNQNVNITTDDSKDQHESSPKHQKT